LLTLAAPSPIHAAVVIAAGASLPPRSTLSLLLFLFPLASPPCPAALGQSEEVRPRASDASCEPVAMRHLLSRVPHVSHSKPSPSLLSSVGTVYVDQREDEP